MPSLLSAPMIGQGKPNNKIKLKEELRNESLKTNLKLTSHNYLNKEKHLLVKYPNTIQKLQHKGSTKIK